MAAASTVKAKSRTRAQKGSGSSDEDTKNPSPKKRVKESKKNECVSQLELYIQQKIQEGVDAQLKTLVPPPPKRFAVIVDYVDERDGHSGPRDEGSNYSTCVYQCATLELAESKLRQEIMHEINAFLYEQHCEEDLSWIDLYNKRQTDVANVVTAGEEFHKHGIQVVASQFGVQTHFRQVQTSNSETYVELKDPAFWPTTKLQEMERWFWPGKSSRIADQLVKCPPLLPPPKS